MGSAPRSLRTLVPMRRHDPVGGRDTSVVLRFDAAVEGVNQCKSASLPRYWHLPKSITA
jgi:hypothetical protein